MHIVDATHKDNWHKYWNVVLEIRRHSIECSKYNFANITVRLLALFIFPLLSVFIVCLLKWFSKAEDGKSGKMVGVNVNTRRYF